MSRALALRLSMPILIAMAATTPAVAQSPVFRCGNSYSSQPCDQATTVALADAPSLARQREARSVAEREQRLADTMRRDRLRDEREAASRVAVAGIGTGPRSRLPDAPAAARSEKKGKKGGVGRKLGLIADDPKITQVIVQQAPRKKL